MFNVDEDFNTISVPIGTRVKIHLGDKRILGEGIVLTDAYNTFFDSRTLQLVRIDKDISTRKPLVGEEWLFDTEDLEIIA